MAFRTAEERVVHPGQDVDVGQAGAVRCCRAVGGVVGAVRAGHRRDTTDLGGVAVRGAGRAGAVTLGQHHRVVGVRGVVDQRAARGEVRPRHLNLLVDHVAGRRHGHRAGIRVRATLAAVQRWVPHVRARHGGRRVADRREVLGLVLDLALELLDRRPGGLAGPSVAHRRGGVTGRGCGLHARLRVDGVRRGGEHQHARPQGHQARHGEHPAGPDGQQGRATHADS